MGELFKALREVARTLRVGSESRARTERLIVLSATLSLLIVGVFLGVGWVFQHVWFGR